MRTHGAAALILAGLSLAGCANKSVCQDACEKRKSWAQSVKCAQVPAAEQAGCTTASRTFAGDDCGAITTCAGAEKTAAEEIMACTLNNFGACPATPSDGPKADILCHRPATLDKCWPPPNQYSATLWYCSGCGDCEGSRQTAACSLIKNNDCRFFATSCIPLEYSLCDGSSKDNQLNFLCGYCFLSDAGPARLIECNKLPDGGLTPRDAGQKH